MLRLRASTAEQARLAAEEAVAKEVARAQTIAPVASENTQLAVRDWSADAFVADRRDMFPVPFETPPRFEGKTWIIAAAAAVVVVLVGGLFAFNALKNRRSAPAANAAVAAPVETITPTATEEIVAEAGSGELRIESVPDGARVVLDGREAGFTPLTLKNVPAGRHSLLLEGDSGTLRRTVRVQAGERTIARYEITAGFLSVNSRVPLEIFDGNRKLGSSDGGHILLAPGQYNVRLVNAHYGYRDDAEFTIKPGEPARSPRTLSHSLKAHSASRLNQALKSSSKANWQGFHRSRRSGCQSALAKCWSGIPSSGNGVSRSRS
jgi:hypothetical protein